MGLSSLERRPGNVAAMKRFVSGCIRNGLPGWASRSRAEGIDGRTNTPSGQVRAAVDHPLVPDLAERDASFQSSEGIDALGRRRDGQGSR